MENLIVSTNKSDKKVEMSIYELIEEFYATGRRFLVSHITEEEYEEMSRQLDRGFLFERLDRTTKKGYDTTRWMIALDSLNQTLKFSDYNDIDKNGSYIFKSGKLEWEKGKKSFVSEPDSNKYTIGIKVYTTKTYDEVIEHYKSKEETQNMPKTLSMSLAQRRY